MTDVTLNRTAAPTYEGMKPADPGGIVLAGAKIRPELSKP
jgi:hypothetical protein